MSISGPLLRLALGGGYRLCRLHTNAADSSTGILDLFVHVEQNLAAPQTGVACFENAGKSLDVRLVQNQRLFKFAKIHDEFATSRALYFFLSYVFDRHNVWAVQIIFAEIISAKEIPSIRRVREKRISLRRRPFLNSTIPNGPVR